ncbi:kinesin-like protein KIN-4C isoform X1 [Papaver somniferum]|uniref:kinesin-like protein KIN-4C isoform X1 n=2 Tax=Papaver somniferum TaxID=3469 RepID=UPI000E7011E2|nr:kinesin-like protein KIN-4C isoform X1 [Papaver somniferum]
MGIVKVAVNVRPLSDEEVLKGCKNCVAFIPGEPQVKIGTHSFTLHHVYGNKASSPISIYGDCVAPLVDALFDGYNATVLAHGQTGSGKTYTMGTNYTGDGSTGGIIPQVMNSIFSKIEEKKEAKEFLIRVSFIEIFREEVIDLLDPNSGKGKRTVAKVAAKKPIPIRELEEGLFTVPDAAAVEVRTKQQMASFLSQGSLKRATGSTNMNSQSSRSHAIFTISMEQRRSTRIPGDGILSAKLQFVDLAGSGSMNKSGADGEGIPINKGILALEQVIIALVVNKKRKEGGHVPYHNSKLTQLLKDSLDGNIKTVMIACVRPADSYITETLNTLTCAYLARNIQNKAIVGTVNQSHELECLRKALTLEKNRSMDKSAELESLKKALTLSEEHIARERKCSMDKSAEIEQLKLKISVAQGEIRELHQNDKALQKENRLLKDELLHMKSNASP